MKLLRLAIFVVAACFGSTLFVIAQSNQATPDQSSTPNQTPSAVQPIAPPQIGTPAKPEQKPFVAPKLLGKNHRLVDPATTGQPRSQGDFDNGIYVKKGAGSGTCGAIVSYNFSAGENPSLQSVTTCTPANPEAPLRTGHEKQPKPPAPQLRKAVLESGQPQP